MVDVFFFGRKTFIIFLDLVLLGMINRAILIVPSLSVEDIVLQFFDQHRRREHFAFRTNIEPYAALEASSNIIAGVSENDYRIIAYVQRFLERGPEQLLSDTLSLVSGPNAEGTEGEDRFLVPCFVDQFVFRVHDVANDLTVQFRNKIFVASHPGTYKFQKASRVISSTMG